MDVKRKLTVGDLFSGIGGFSLGLERTGEFETKWFVETDPFCNRVLAKHWPDVRRYGDIKECGKHNLEPVDLICGGFPCQPFSVAGKQRGSTDDRYLWPEMLRVIREVRPTWVLGENVAGIINMALDQVLSDLEAEGYDTQTFVIPACGVDATHRRDRVWIVAYNSQFNSWTGEEPRGQGVEVANSGQSEWYNRLSQPGLGGMADGLSSWLHEPAGVPRVATGVKDRVNRLKALGNSVVPQVVEAIGHAIIASHTI